MKYDVVASWALNYFCNFRCEYCSVLGKNNSKYKGKGIKEIINGFNKFGIVWYIQMSGGEPFLHPDFVELCKELTKNHFISMNTNLSTKNVYDFADQIDPRKVEFVHCSLHIDERKRLNLIKDFIDKYHYLRKHGFEVFASQVMYPPILKRFDKIFDFFKKNGIIVRPRIFWGNYRSKNYPHSYTAKEREKIIRYCSPDIFPRDDLRKLVQIFAYGDLSFKGLLCKAGRDFVRIKYNGDVERCFGEKVSLGNLFERKIRFYKEPKKCSARICSCPVHGLKFATGGYNVVKR